MQPTLFRIVVMICSLLTANAALASHELIVIPERHSDQQSGHKDKHRSNTHTRHTESENQYRSPYLTTYFGGGFGTGGDVVGRFTDNFGDTERIRSGGGFYFEGGLLLAIDNAALVRLTAGFETDRADRSNGLAAFDRTRFDLTLLRNFGGFELGVGVTAHVGVDYDCNINSICADGLEFDNALGYTLEAALTSFSVWNNYGSRRSSRRSPISSARLGLRFTDIEYTPTFGSTLSSQDDVLDGRSLSIFVGFAL